MTLFHAMAFRKEHITRLRQKPGRSCTIIPSSSSWSVGHHLYASRLSFTITATAIIIIIILLFFLLLLPLLITPITLHSPVFTRAARTTCIEVDERGWMCGSHSFPDLRGDSDATLTGREDRGECVR